MSFGKCCTPAQIGFWMDRKTEKCSIKEKAEIEHTYKALEIVAGSQGKDINEQFSQFYKECMYLRALCYWDNYLEEEEDINFEDLDSTDFDYVESEPNQKMVRFFEIMFFEYGKITEDMKKEAFKLFLAIVTDIGNIGTSITCDLKGECF